jgi:hypothetical protein
MHDYHIIRYIILYIKNQDSSVGTVTAYELDNWWGGVQVC